MQSHVLAFSRTNVAIESSNKMKGNDQELFTSHSQNQMGKEEHKLTDKHSRKTNTVKQ